MKKLSLLLVILSIFYACKKEDVSEPYSTPLKIVITGQVLHANDSMRKVQLYINWIGKEQEEIQAELDSVGKFQTYFDAYSPVDFYVSYQTNFVLIAFPGDSLHIVFDGSIEERAPLLKALTVSGNRAGLNKELSAFQAMYFGSQLFNIWDEKERAVQQLEPVLYKKYIDSLHTEAIKIYNAFDSTYHPSEEAKRWAKAEITESYFSDLTFYPRQHKMMNKLGAEWEVAEDYYDYFEQNDFSFDSALFATGPISGYSNKYLSYVWRESSKQYQSFSEEERKDNPNLYDSLVFANTITHTNNELLKQVAITEVLTNYLEASSIEKFEHFKPFAETHLTKTYLKKPLFEAYENLIKLRDTPLAAYEKKMENLEPFFIEQIAEKFRGKVVYVDIWATWCSPCRGEFKYSSALHKQYGDSIEFVYICVDSDEEAFQNTVKKFDLQGTHYFLDREQSKELYKQVKLTGVPHYIIIDHLGKVVNKGFEYRPSESIAKKSLKALIEKAKKE